MKTLRLFISSPGDVGREREATRRVIDRLQSEFAEHVTDEPEFRDLIGKLSGLRYMAGGLDVAGWADDLSRYFEDAGGVAYRMIRNLEDGKRATKWS